MAPRPLAALLALALLAASACGGGAGPAATPTPTATSTASAVATATLTATETPEASPTSPPVATETSSGAAARVVSSGDPGRAVVALTFDAGSDTGFAAQILDTLAANGITAAFGITGRWAEANPALVRRIVADGHELINHSYDHASFTGLSTGLAPLTRAQRWAQLDATEQAVQTIAGASTKPYFRPPFGDYDGSVLADVGARGYAYSIMWTVDSMGWNGLSAAAITQRCLAQAQNGAVYIFHVGAASQDAAALQDVIDGLRARGYGFVSVSEMIGR